MFGSTVCLILVVVSPTHLRDGEIQPLLHQLEHRDFAKRQFATRRLKLANFEQRKQFFAHAATSASPEVLARCSKVLQTNASLKWILYLSQIRQRLGRREHLARQLVESGGLIERAEVIADRWMDEWSENARNPNPWRYFDLKQYQTMLNECDYTLSFIDRMLHDYSTLREIKTLNKPEMAWAFKDDFTEVRQSLERLRRSVSATRSLAELHLASFRAPQQNLIRAYRVFMAQAYATTSIKELRAFAAAARRIALGYPQLKLSVATCDQMIEIAHCLTEKDRLLSGSKPDEYFEKDIRRWQWSAICGCDVVCHRNGQTQNVHTLGESPVLLDEMAQSILHRANDQLESRDFATARRLTKAAELVDAKYNRLFGYTPSMMYAKITHAQKSPKRDRTDLRNNTGQLKQRVLKLMGEAQAAAQNRDFEQAIRKAAVAEIFAENVEFGLFEDRPDAILRRIREQQANENNP